MEHDEKVFRVYINTENEAFAPDRSEEVARILFEIANHIRINGMDSYKRPVHDMNGNKVGLYAHMSRRDWAGFVCS